MAGMEQRSLPHNHTQIVVAWSALVALGMCLFALLTISTVSTTQAAPLRPDLSYQSSSLLADCAGPVAGKDIYDCAGALTSDQIAALETHLATVDQAGAKAVVYLQAKDATQDQTDQDAVNLMQNWDIETKAGAKDGFVILLNLTPGNLAHGHVALYAGATLVSGPLTQNEQARIFNDVMLPYLQNGQLADGISAALDAAAADIRAGAPVSNTSGSSSNSGPDYTTVNSFTGDPHAQAFGGLPFNILALLFALFSIFLLRHHPGKRQAIPDAAASSKADDVLPNDLPPAVAGALVTGHVRDDQIEGAIFDFANRKLLAIEPIDHDSVQVKLLASGSHLTGYEALIWRSLAQHADKNDVVLNSELVNVRGQWYMARTELQQELERRGWFDADVDERRHPFYVVGTIGLVAACIGLIIAFVGLSGWALLATIILAAMGVIMLVRGHAILDTTSAGEEAALPWRALQQQLVSQSLALSEPGHRDDGVVQKKLDTLLPYAVAMGSSFAMTPLLESESRDGYTPAWFRPVGRSYNPGLGFYPYWIGWHSSIYPVSTSSSSYHGYSGGFSGGFSGGSFGGGGAAAGGGGAGGAF